MGRSCAVRMDRTSRAAAEPDDGDRPEYLLAAGDIEVDVVPGHVDEPGTLLRLGVRQGGHGHSGHQGGGQQPRLPAPARLDVSDSGVAEYRMLSTQIPADISVPAIHFGHQEQLTDVR